MEAARLKGMDSDASIYCSHSICGTVILTDRNRAVFKRGGICPLRVCCRNHVSFMSVYCDGYEGSKKYAYLYS